MYNNFDLISDILFIIGWLLISGVTIYYAYTLNHLAGILIIGIWLVFWGHIHKIGK